MTANIREPRVNAVHVSKLLRTRRQETVSRAQYRLEEASAT